MFWYQVILQLKMKKSFWKIKTFMTKSGQIHPLKQSFHTAALENVEKKYAS